MMRLPEKIGTTDNPVIIH